MNWDLVRKNLAAIIEREKTSHTALAEASGVPQPTISRFIGGQHEALKLETLATLASALHSSVGEILGERPYTQDPKISKVIAIMERLPEYKKDAIVKVSDSFDEPDGLKDAM